MPVGVSAYVPLANVTVSIAATTVTFSSISGSYRDLILVINGTASSGSGLIVTHNSDTTSANYNSVTMSGDGSTTSSFAATNANLGSMLTTPTAIIQQFMDYSATDKHKTALSRTNWPGGFVNAQTRRWANTAAITSISLTLDVAVTFAAGSTFALYGVTS